MVAAADRWIGLVWDCLPCLRSPLGELRSLCLVVKCQRKGQWLCFRWINEGPTDVELVDPPKTDAQQKAAIDLIL